MKTISVIVCLLWTHNLFALNKIALGSCNHQNRPQPMWNILSNEAPDLFIWLGDNIYADTSNEKEMIKKYKKQLANKSYQDFVMKTPLIGTWDDHDYGKNDAGKEYKMKEISQKLLLDFLGEDKNSFRRYQKGIYTSYQYQVSDKSLNIILLDVRYFRDKLGVKGGDVLGEEQWKWLENELRTNASDITLIISSYSVLSPKLPIAEEWADFPIAKKKLFQLIDKYEPSGLLFITGDRHFSASLERRYNNNKYIELMSSGLTHSHSNENIQKAVKSIYGAKNVYFGLNAATLNILWEANPLELSFNIINPSGQVPLSQKFILNQKKWQKTK